MKDTIFIVLIFGLGIAAIYAFAKITEKVDAQHPPDYKLRTYSYKKVLKRSLFGIFVVVVASIGIFAFSRSFNFAISVGASLLCIVLAYLVWGLYWQRYERRSGARPEDEK